MVIRNYAPHLGVRSGTRVMVRKMTHRLLTVVILTGPKQGNEVKLPEFVAILLRTRTSLSRYVDINSLCVWRGP